MLFITDEQNVKEDFHEFFTTSDHYKGRYLSTHALRHRSQNLLVARGNPLLDGILPVWDKQTTNIIYCFLYP